MFLGFRSWCHLVRCLLLLRGHCGSGNSSSFCAALEHNLSIQISIAQGFPKVSVICTVNMHRITKGLGGSSFDHGRFQHLICKSLDIGKRNLFARWLQLKIWARHERERESEWARNVNTWCNFPCSYVRCFRSQNSQDAWRWLHRSSNLVLMDLTMTLFGLRF